MLTPHRSLIKALIAAVVVSLALWTSAEASSVMPMALDTLADHSGQVIVGTVTTVRSYWADNPRRIESEITLAEVEYLKGKLPDSRDTFSFIVPGGEVGEIRMTICCAPEFHVGERWILFLLPAYRTFPVVGLYQGAFLIQPDADGIERVVYRRHGQAEPIVGINAGGFVQQQSRRYTRADDHLLAARNVRLLTPTNATEQQALTYEEFVAQLEPVLEASRDHQLTEPAGRRILVQYRGVPLRRSLLQQAIDKEVSRPAVPLPRGLDVVQEESETTRPTDSVGEEVSP